jgi:hypothetical protein
MNRLKDLEASPFGVDDPMVRPAAREPARDVEPLKVAEVHQRFRLLKENEVVGRGDFVTADHLGFEPWEGPTGFRADAYVRQIYRLEGEGAARKGRKLP